MSSSMNRLFEPSYIWNYHEERTEKRGIMSRILGVKPDEKMVKGKCHGKYEELNENVEQGTNDQCSGSVLQIMDSKNDTFIFNWRNGTEKIKNFEVSEKELSVLFIQTLKNCNYQIGELFLCLGRGKLNSRLSVTEGLLKINVAKLYLRLETLDMLKWWLEHVSPNGLKELNLSPYGDHPIDIPSEIFEMSHFRTCQTMCLMEHCSFSSNQFNSICSSVSHLSFYSDTILENVVKSAMEEKINSMKGKEVVEWFFSRRVNTKEIIQEIVGPDCDRKERFSHQKQCFEPVEVYKVSNENNKKMSLMIISDPYDNSKPYSLVLFS